LSGVGALQSAKRNSKVHTIRTLLAALVGSIALFLIACSAQKDGGAMNSGQDPKRIALELGLSIPSDARVVGVKRTRGLDDAIFVKAEVASASWSAWLPSAPFKREELTPEASGYLAPDDGWWDPGQVEGLRAVQINPRTGEYLNVGVDEKSKAGVVVLYLMKHGT
jgi:hypothetical protein